MNVNNLLTELNSSLRSLITDYIGLYFYGSRAIGLDDFESDVDVVILLCSVDIKKKYMVYELISFLMNKYCVFIDIKILTYDQFEFNPFFYEEVKSKGFFYAA